MAHFDDAILPVTIRVESAAGPSVQGQVQFTGGGYRFTNRQTQQFQRRLQIDYRKAIQAGKTDIPIDDIVNFWEAVTPFNTFLTRDWTRWNTSTNQQPGGDAGVTNVDQVLQNTTDDSFVGDGTTTTFRVMWRSQVGSAQENQLVRKPDPSGFVAAAAGSPMAGSLSLATGIFTASVAPGVGEAVTWGGKFYRPVAFVGLDLVETLRTFETANVGFEMVEVRL